jgi:hypothetical protein
MLTFIFITLHQAYNKEGVGPASNTLVATTTEDGKLPTTCDVNTYDMTHP